MFCPQCGAETPETFLFCRQCGAGLKKGTAVTRASAESQSQQAPAAPALPALPRQGALFAGRYEIIEELGRGGMGIVYKAHDARLNEKSAIKLLLPQYTAEPRILERFLSEVRTARRLSHPNIVKVYDLGEAEGTVYFSMEYLEGRDLDTLLEEEGPLSFEKATDIVRCVALALDTAHASRVVHRDVKPQNIFLTNDQVVKVLDFGIAKALDSPGVSMTGGMVGTPAYMAPEQVTSSGTTDHRGDIYSLGVVMYQLFTGQVPFRGESPFEVALQHVHTEPAPAREVNPDIPIHIERIIQRAMQKDPVRRYGTVADLIADLDRKRVIETPLGPAGGEKGTVLVPSMKPGPDPMDVPTHLAHEAPDSPPPPPSPAAAPAMPPAEKEPSWLERTGVPSEPDESVAGPAPAVVSAAGFPEEGNAQPGAREEEPAWTVIYQGKFLRGLSKQDVETGIASGRYGPEEKARRGSGRWQPLSAHQELAESFLDALKASRQPRIASLPRAAKKAAPSVARRLVPIALILVALGGYQIIRGQLKKSAIALDLQGILSMRFYQTDVPTPKGLRVIVDHPEKRDLDLDLVDLAKRQGIRCKPGDLHVAVDPKRRVIRLTLDFEIPMFFIPVHYTTMQEKEGVSRAQLRRFLDDPDTEWLGATIEEVRQMSGG